MEREKTEGAEEGEGNGKIIEGRIMTEDSVEHGKYLIAWIGADWSRLAGVCADVPLQNSDFKLQYDGLRTLLALCGLMDLP